MPRSRIVGREEEDVKDEVVSVVVVVVVLLLLLSGQLEGDRGKEGDVR